MTLNVKQLPREILEKAVQLRNCQRNIFIALYSKGKPSSAQEIANLVGVERAYAHMRLLQLVEKGLAKEHKQGKQKLFEVST
jgi:predicted transcriptional regulator